MSDPRFIVRQTLERARATDFAGYDPFDGLNSRLFNATPLAKSRLARLAWLQFLKRSPINIRPLVGVPRTRNAKGVALFILGMLELAEMQEDRQELLAQSSSLGDWLLNACVDEVKWGRSAWGYHFPWEARAFYVPVGKPNAISTCYVATALRRLSSATGDLRYAVAANDAGRFLDSALRTKHEDRTYYAYVPGEPVFVHNANLWVAAVVAETARATGDAELGSHALEAARQTVSMQNEDGSWYYGTRAHHGFIDGFHTGYNLEALVRLSTALNTEIFSANISRGYSYYNRTFIEPSGFVRYYSHSRWPEETHSFAQAVITVLRVGKDTDLASRIVVHALRSLYQEKRGAFMYQRWRWTANRIEYIRWSQAWAFYALALFNRVSIERQES